MDLRVTVALRVPLGLGITSGIYVGLFLGSWFRRHHGPEGTFEEAFVAGPESGSGVLMEPYESIWKKMWSWDKYQEWARSLEKMQSLMHLSSPLCLLGMIYTALLEGCGFFDLSSDISMATCSHWRSSHSSCGVLGREPVEEKSGQAAIALLIPNPRFTINALMGTLKYICHRTLHTKSDSKINCSYTEHSYNFIMSIYIMMVMCSTWKL